jgi:hypothetical protein
MNFVQNLPVTKAKIEGAGAIAGIPIIGAMFGPGPDDKVTDLGLTVGCVKSLPKSAGELMSLLTQLAPEIAKGIVAKNLGVKRKDIPSDINELKGFAMEKSKEMVSEALGVDAEDVPEKPQELEKFIKKEMGKKKSSKELGKALAVVGLMAGLDMLGGGGETKKSSKKPKVVKDEEEDEEEEEPKPKKSPKKRVVAKDEDEDDEEEEEPKPKKSPKKQAVAKYEDEDEEEDEPKPKKRPKKQEIARGVYFDIGIGVGQGSTKIDGYNMFDEIDSYSPVDEMIVDVTIFKLGYGPLGNAPVYLVWELSAMGHRIYDSSDFVQYNSYLFGPGVIFYPIPLLQLGASIGYSFVANQTSSPYITMDKSDGGSAYNISAALDFGGGNHGLLVGLKYFSATNRLNPSGDDQNSSMVGIFVKYAYRHKSVSLEE